MMFSGFKAYKVLRSFGGGRYPDPRTIRRHLQDFRCYYGLNDEMFFVIRQKLATALKNDRNLIMSFDEMQVQFRASWSAHFKEMVPGANKVMVVMVRGQLKKH